MKILQTLHISNPLSSLLQLLSFLKLLSILALILLFIVPHHVVVLLAGLIIEFFTKYYTSNAYCPLM
jgi:hypothetical protein